MAHHKFYLTAFVDRVDNVTASYATERDRLVAARSLFAEHPDSFYVCANIMDDGEPYLWSYTPWDLAPSTPLSVVLAIYTPDGPDTDDRTPSACPICGCTGIRQAVNEWHATCIDDPENDAVLTEHQCEICGVSFWL